MSDHVHHAIVPLRSSFFLPSLFIDFKMRSVLALSAVAGLAAAAPVERAETDPTRFTYYDMPSILAGPCDLANGPDGFIWGEDVCIVILIFPEKVDANLLRSSPTTSSR